MKSTLTWLKEHLDTDASVDAIADKLTMIGLEVESVHDRTKEYAPFRIARVVSAEKHPNADRLRVCMVDTGDGKAIQVVCGAPNARTGMIGVFAPAGTYIPGTGAQLEKGVIRGVESNGMLLSERELGISDAHEGIVDLPEDAPVGGAYATYAGLDDPVIDVAVTPNRPDALGVEGIARDLAAAGMGTLVTPAIVAVKGSGACPVKVRLDLDRPELCPAFGLRPVAGVAAAATARHRPPPDQRPGRHHQLRHPRPLPAAACLRRGEDFGQPRRPPCERWRGDTRSRRPHLSARPGNRGDRRQQRA